MKILFDHNVPKRLRNALPEHIVKTAREMNWDELENGHLLRTAELNGFELMITCDQNLSYQQNLSDRKLSLMVLSTNNWTALRANFDLIAKIAAVCTPGDFHYLKVHRTNN